MKVESKILLPFVVAFLVLLLIGAVTYGNNLALQQRNAQVTQTYAVLDTIGELFNAAFSMETATRGYLITGQEEYLEPVRAGIDAIERLLPDLRKKVAGSPVQIANLGNVEISLRTQVETNRRSIERRRTTGLGEELPSLLESDKRSMDNLRQQIAAMRQHEAEVLRRRTQETVIGARNVNVTFIVLMTAALLMLVIFFSQVRRDLRERRQITALARRNEERFRRVLDAAPDALVISDRAGRITLANPAFARLFGIDVASAAGRTLTEFLRIRPHPDGRAEGELSEWNDKDDAQSPHPAPPAAGDTLLAPRIERVLAGPRPTGMALQGVRERNADLPHAAFEGVRPGDGTGFPVEITRGELGLSPHDEEVTITAIRDRTERELAEDELRRYSEDLARSNAELERFAYVASHDLQEPLRMVSSYTQLLRRRYSGKLDADANEFIDFAVDGANRMQKLIQDLLAYSRVGSRAIEAVPVDCERLVDRVLRDMEKAFEERGARVERETLPLVRGDATQLGQLFQNLLSNATKFARPGVPPVVRVSIAAREKKFWQFSIHDNGIGIDSAYFERIFIIFQRLHGKNEYPGTGIGLAICKKIVERHGGRLWVESKIGEGSNFLFTLPRVDA